MGAPRLPAAAGAVGVSNQTGFVGL